MDNGRAGAAAGIVLIAPDKFKGCLTANEVALSVANGMRRSRPDLNLDLCPVADGGEGTLDAAISAGYRPVVAEVEGPTGERLSASYGERDGCALIELAEAAGLRRMTRGVLAPLTASTFGAGQLISEAIKAGNRTIILAVGGSATSDGGAGIVQALGGRLTDEDGQPLERGGGALARIARIDLRQLRSQIDGVRFVIASDVENPLLGPTGAATVFGPQKGASPSDVEALERGLARWASVVADATGVDAAGNLGAGAAGGVGFGAITILGAALVSGADMVLDMVQFENRARRADLVVTGEGSLDEQSLFGKAPIKVAEAAFAAGVRTVAVAGQCSISASRLSGARIQRVYSLQAIEPDADRSIADARPLLEELGGQIARVEMEPTATASI